MWLQQSKFGFAKEDVLWKLHPFKEKCKERRQCCYESSMIFTHYRWMHTKAGWFLLKIHGTAWLSQKWLRDPPLLVEMSEVISIELSSLYRKKHIQYQLQVQFCYKICYQKKSWIFINQFQPTKPNNFQPKKTPKFLGPFFVEPLWSAGHDNGSLQPWNWCCQYLGS